MKKKLIITLGLLLFLASCNSPSDQPVGRNNPATSEDNRPDDRKEREALEKGTVDEVYRMAGRIPSLFENETGNRSVSPVLSVTATLDSLRFAGEEDKNDILSAMDLTGHDPLMQSERLKDKVRDIGGFDLTDRVWINQDFENAKKTEDNTKTGESAATEVFPFSEELARR